MAILEIVTPSLATLLILFGAGLPWVLRLRGFPVPVRWGIAPGVGFAVVSAIAHLCGALGLGVERFLVPLLSSIAVCLGLAAFAARRMLGRSLSSANLALGGLVLVALIFALQPLLTLGYPTVVGGTIDAISHVSRAEVVQVQGLDMPPLRPFHPVDEWAAAPMLANIRMGDVYLLAVVTTFVGGRAYEVFTPVVAVLFGLTPFALYSLARAGLRLPHRSAVLAAALAATSHLLLWAVFDTFLSQAAGGLLLTTLLAIGFAAQRRPTWGTLALGGLVLGGLVSAYPAYAVVGLLALGSAVLGRTMWNAFQRQGSLLAPFGLLASTILIALASNPVAAKRAAGELLLVAGESRGGNITIFPHPGEILGLVNHPLAAYTTEEPTSKLHTFGLALLLLATAWGVWRVKAACDRISAASFLLITLALAIEQRFGILGHENGFPYGYFKSLTPLALASIPLLAHGIVDWFRNASHQVTRVATAAAAIIVLAVNTWQVQRTTAFVVSQRIVLDRSLLDIADRVDHLAPEEGVVIDAGPGLVPYWLGYLLGARRLHYLRAPGIYSVREAGSEGFPARHAVVDLAAATHEEALPRSALAWRSDVASKVKWANSRFEFRVSTSPPPLDLGKDPLCTKAGTPLILQAEETHLRIEHEDDWFLLPTVAGEHVVAVTTTWSGPSELVFEREGGAALRIAIGSQEHVLSLRQGESLVLAEEQSGDLCLVDVRILPGTTQIELHPRRSLPGMALRSTLKAHGSHVEIVGRLTTTGPPLHQGAAVRIGLHISATAPASGHFGVWALDFPIEEETRDFRLRLDLDGRQAIATSEGTTNGVLPGAALGPDSGAFVATLAVWDLRDVSAPRYQQQVFQFSGEPGAFVVQPDVAEINVAQWWREF